MNNIWFSADLHLNHARILDLCDRPYDNVEAMNDDLLHRWNSLIDDDDLVFILGDLAMGQRTESVPLFAEFNGRKLLIAGNHDHVWGHSKQAQGERSQEWFDLYQKQGGIQGVSDELATTLNGQVVQMCHFPYAGDSQDEDRYLEARPEDVGRWLLHGHVHTEWRQRGRMINVGVDAWGGYPVGINTLERLMRNGEQDRQPLDWKS